MENTMRGNDMQNRCGLNDTQELRSPAEVDCQQPESPQGGPRHLGEACAPRTGTSARGSGHRPELACATAARRPAARLRSGFGSRLRAGLLCVLTLVLVLPFAWPSCSSGGRGSATGLDAQALGAVSDRESFRLLFVTSTTRNASSTNISDYNSFVQGRAAAGHSLIRPFSSKFRVVGSTASVDARQYLDHLHQSSQGRADLLAERRQGRGRLRGLLRRQLGQQERQGKEPVGDGVQQFLKHLSGTRDDGTKASHIKSLMGCFPVPWVWVRPAIQLRKSDAEINFTFANR